jgi:NADH-quinone oxidoreductase subunit E
MKFSEEKLQKVQEIMARYPEGKSKSALIPLLHLAQEQNGGWLSAEAMDYVAELLQLKPIEVYEVCQTGPCMLRGSDNIIEYIKTKLGIAVGETTKDGMFTLKTVECLGACGYAPMMQLGKYYKEHLTREKVDQIIDECRSMAAKNN